MSEEQIEVTADPHGLIASGERLCTISGLAAEHGLSRTLVRLIVNDEGYREIKYVDRRPHRLYLASDFAAVVARLRPRIEERARRIAETEAADAERGRLRRERAAAPKPAKTKRTPPPAAPAPPPPPVRPMPVAMIPRRPTADGPEVIVVRRRGASR